jgi:hypothetical protein
LAALLNSRYVNDAIKPFQSTGLLGERDVHKKVLELPIPTFDHASQDHCRLAELGELAAKEAAAIIKSQAFPAGSSLARQRACVRHGLKSLLREIDKLVQKILRST